MSSGDEASGCTLDRTALLKQAKECFEACLRLRGDEEDTWLHSLMLAKIVYKMNAPLSQSLEYCMQVRALDFLLLLMILSAVALMTVAFQKNN